MGAGFEILAVARYYGNKDWIVQIEYEVTSTYFWSLEW